MPNTANERQIQGSEINPDNLDIEYDENENVNIQIPQEGLDEVFSNMLDLEEEEEEWNSMEYPEAMTVLPKGLPIDELSSVALLQKELENVSRRKQHWR